MSRIFRSRRRLSPRLPFARWASPLIAVWVACASESPVVVGSEPPQEVDSDPAVVLAEEALSAWLRAVCAPVVRCGWFEQIEDCLPIAASDAEANGIDRIAAGVASDGVLLDERALASCLSAIEERPCGAMLDFHFRAFTECRELLVGSLPEDAPCHSPFSCSPGLYCQSPEAADCSGICRPVDGMSCTRDDDCAHGRECSRFRCQAPVEPLRQLSVGDSCAKRYEVGVCGPHAKCRDDVCVAVRKEGEICTGATPCEPNELGHNCAIKRAGDCGPTITRLVCDPEARRCARAPVSGPCLGDEFCDLFESWCDTTLEPPTCVPHREPGTACESHLECGPPYPTAFCRDGDEGRVCWRRDVLACATD